MWAPAPVGVSVELVHPAGNWVVIREEHEINRAMLVGGSEKLLIATLGVPNTVYGTLVAGEAEVLEQLNVQVGEMVVYKEWEGSRWDLAGEVYLIMNARHVLAKCEAGE